MDKVIVCVKCKGDMEKGEEGAHLWKSADKKTFIGAKKYYTYACINCGYMESYVEK